MVIDIAIDLEEFIKLFRQVTSPSQSCVPYGSATAGGRFEEQRWLDAAKAGTVIH